MAIEKINFSYPKGTLQSVFDNETFTALELAAKTSKKVDECVEIVNGVEQTAIEATAIVDDMYVIQNQFVTDNSDTRAQLINDNQLYIDELEASKTTFDNNMTNAVNTIIANAETTIETDVNNKIDTLVSNGTMETLINDVILTDVKKDISDLSLAFTEETEDINIKISTITNVKEFGAIGDGITDDTIAIKNAIDNATTTSILFPKGTYLVNMLDITKDIKLIGEMGTIFKAKTFDVTKHTKRVLLNTTPLNNVEFENIEFNGASNGRIVSSERENMIRLENIKNVRFENCKFYNFAAGESGTITHLVWGRELMLLVLHNCENVVINRCELYNNYNEQVLVSSEDERTKLTLTNNYVHDNPRAYAAFLMVNLKSGYVAFNKCIGNYRGFVNLMTRNVVVENNFVMDTSSRGIGAESYTTTPNDNCVIRNNTLINCQEGGINLTGDNVIIDNNYIENCKHGINIIGSTFHTDMTEYIEFNPLCPTTPKEKQEKYRITNNRIYDCSDDGIRIIPQIFIPPTGKYNRFSAENIIISGNIIEPKNKEFSSTRAIYLSRCKDVVISNNTIKSSSTQIFEFYMTAVNVLIDNNILQPSSYDYAFYFRQLLVDDLNASNIVGDIITNFKVTNNQFLGNPSVKMVFFNGTASTLSRINNVKFIDNIGLYSSLLTDQENYLKNPIEYRRVLKFKDEATIPERFSFYVGDVIEFDVKLNSPTNKYCTESGSKGTLTGITGSTSSTPAQEINVNNGDTFMIGDYINISSINYKGWVTGKSGNILQVSPKLTQQIVDAEITLNVPQFIIGFTPTTTP